MKRQAMYWREMSANHVSDTKDKYVAYTKNLQNSTVTKPNSPIRK